ncbi:HEAT repeat domain-containing protein [Streptomyces sp. NPDC006733]|uniref:HEAT repeat domain-containing protein n=1 Tax=Streptomyces sp. NPDC006733 TaxID=3155460 RepID=UPI0033FA38E8
MTDTFREAMRLMRTRDPQRREDGFHQLLPHAADFVDELLGEFAQEQDQGLRRWLLELIGATRAPAALPTLSEQLHSPDESIRHWAAVGLTRLDTPEARTVLWRARANGTIT